MGGGSVGAPDREPKSTWVTGSRRALSDRRLSWPTGYLIIHVVQSLLGLVIMYSLVLPIVHNQGLEMLRGLGIGM